MTTKTIYTKKNKQAFKPMITQLVSNIVAGQKVIEETESKVIFEMKHEDVFFVKMVLSKRIPFVEISGEVNGSVIKVNKNAGKIEVVSGGEQEFQSLNYELNKILSVKKRGSKEDEE